MKNLVNKKLIDDNFWTKIKKPIIGLSPMDGVTDQPYRHIQKKYGSPDVIYTEFTNVEGVCHGAVQLLKEFLYDETQRPIIAQIYGKTPEYFRQVAIILCQLGFDGIDINMGCPAKSVDHSGSGAALIKTPKLAQEIIKATKQGVQDYLDGQRAKDCNDISNKIAKVVEDKHDSLPKKYKVYRKGIHKISGKAREGLLGYQQARSIPVSVKTRIGYSTPIVEQWIPALLEMKPALIALHGRTLKQQYSGESNWDEIKKAAKLCHEAGIPILGNGDIKTMNDALEKIKKYNVDGVLIGRASFGNPFVFGNKDGGDNQNNNQKNIFKVALDHCKVFKKTYFGNERYNFMPMRKHLGWYVKSIPNAKIVRAELFKTNSPEEVEIILKKYKLL